MLRVHDETGELIARAAAAVAEGLRLTEELEQELMRTKALHAEAASRARTFNHLAVIFVENLPSSGSFVS